MRLPGGRSRTALRRDRSRDCSRRARARSQAVTIVVAEPASADSAAVTGITPTRNSLASGPAAHRRMALILYVHPPAMIGKHRADFLAGLAGVIGSERWRRAISLEVELVHIAAPLEGEVGAVFAGDGDLRGNESKLA
jgi:hypothetical protein